MTEEQMFLALNKLNDLQEQLEELWFTSSHFWSKNIESWPEYKKITKEIINAKKIFEDQLTCFTVSFDDDKDCWTITPIHRTKEEK